jgi:uncharacterized membrane protein
MPYCTNCGTQVKESAVFCQSCGARQTVAGTSAGRGTPLDSITPRTASILCYVPMVGWLGSVLVLASERFRNERAARFHAFQGLYLFIGWLLLSGVMKGPIFQWRRGHFGFDFGGVMSMVFLGVWIFMMIKASQNEQFRLPLLGEWAERSL